MITLGSLLELVPILVEDYIPSEIGLDSGVGGGASDGIVVMEKSSGTTRLHQRVVRTSHCCRILLFHASRQQSS